MRPGKRERHKRQRHGEKEEARRETEKAARREPAEPRDPGTAERTALGLSCLVCDPTVRLWG